MIEYHILEGIFKNITNVENRIRLLNVQFQKLSVEEIKSLIKTLPYTYSDIAMNRKRPSIPLNNYNIEYVTKLYNIGLSSSFKTDNDEIKIVANY